MLKPNITAWLAFEPFDLQRYLFWQLGPGLLVLCLGVGSFLLWRRTKRISALTQLVASALLVMAALLDHVLSFAIPTELWVTSRLVSTLHNMQGMIAIGAVVVFSLAYVWYAVERQ